VRFVVEFYRYHEQRNLWGGPLDTSQMISLALFAVGASRFLIFRSLDAAGPAPRG
jgi:prolipoprotein diacylglyceryltransferase